MTQPTMPWSRQAERALLGAWIRDPHLAVECAVEPEDFHAEPHQHVARSVLRLLRRGVAVDLVSVGTELEEGNRLDAVGGPIWLTELLDECATTVGAAHMADVVRERASQRRMARLAIEGAEQAMRAKGRTEAAAWFETNLLPELQERHGPRRTTLGAEEVMGSVLAAIQAAQERPPGGTSGLTTGHRSLDGLTGGLHPGELWVVGGRPGMGKTALMVGSMAHRGACAGRHVVVFSLEMPASQIGMRLVSQETRLPVQVLRGQRRLRPTEVESVTRAVAELAAWHGLVVDDRGGVSLGYVEATCRYLARTAPLDLVVIDYLQLMQTPRAETRDQALGAITRGLKALAKDLRCPIVLGSQLNRKLEERRDKRPILSDLRESGNVEQDTDVVVFVYRDEVYHPDTEEHGGELIVAKNRHGATGTCRVAWLGETSQFVDPGRESK